ncbi:MAG: CPBP family intramembrane glutamic endopeptidase, partial [Bacteroidales bacterium]
MNKTAIFRQSSTGLQIFLLLFLIVFLTLISLLVIAVVTNLIFGLPMESLNHLSPERFNLNLVRTVQIISQIGVFVLPPLLLAVLVSERADEFLGLNIQPKSLYVITGSLLMFTMLPFIHFLADWNTNLHLPDFMSGIEQWMHDKEQQAELMSLQFLEVTSLRGLIFNLFMIGMMPAIGEELLFRSVVQTLAGKVFRNIHIGIFVSAILFSGMHMQFFGFFPRLLLGLLL